MTSTPFESKVVREDEVGKKRKMMTSPFSHQLKTKTFERQTSRENFKLTLGDFDLEKMKFVGPKWKLMYLQSLDFLIFDQHFTQLCETSSFMKSDDERNIEMKSSVELATRTIDSLLKIRENIKRNITKNKFLSKSSACQSCGSLLVLPKSREGRIGLVKTGDSLWDRDAVSKKKKKSQQSEPPHCEKCGGSVINRSVCFSSSELFISTLSQFSDDESEESFDNTSSFGNITTAESLTSSSPLSSNELSLKNDQINVSDDSWEKFFNSNRRNYLNEQKIHSFSSPRKNCYSPVGGDSIERKRATNERQKEGKQKENYSEKKYEDHEFELFDFVIDYKQQQEEEEKKIQRESDRRDILEDWEMLDQEKNEEEGEDNEKYGERIKKTWDGMRFINDYF